MAGQPFAAAARCSSEQLERALQGMGIACQSIYMQPPQVTLALRYIHEGLMKAS